MAGSKTGPEKGGVAEIGAEDSGRETMDDAAGSGSAHNQDSPPQQQTANHTFLEVLVFGGIWFCVTTLPFEMAYR